MLWRLYASILTESDDKEKRTFLLKCNTLVFSTTKITTDTI
uniref:MOCS3-2 n=1 Tax=Arundo donax TaxID=35708 RepID=A0A0A9EWN6_ARUDO